LLFALVPPTNILGGWATFVVAIVFIGILTALIGDLANSFGCSAGLNADVTAITFVALGTSLPGEVVVGILLYSNRTIFVWKMV